MFICRLILAAALLLSLTPAGWAGVIYDNGVPITNPNLDCSALCPDIVASTARGLFTLASNATLTGIRFWTFQATGAYAGGTLQWQIFQDNGGTQGALIGSDSFTLSQTLVGAVNIAGLQLTEFQNDFSVANLPITPSTPPQSYFLDVKDISGKDAFGIFWATSGRDTLAFQLSGSGNSDPVTSPEPATFALLTVSLAFAFARRVWTVRQRAGDLRT